MKSQDMLRQLELALIARDTRIRDLEITVRKLKLELVKAIVIPKVEKS